MVKPYQSYNRFEPRQSSVIAVAAGQIDLAIDNSRPHNFAGVVFFNDASGVTPVQPSAGTITYTVQLVVQPHAFQAPPDNVINANTVDQVDWAGNTEIVRATFAGIVGATHARLIWAGNSA